MLLNTTISLMRAARDTLTLLIDLAESIRDDGNDHNDQPPTSAHGGITFGSVYGNVDAGPGFGSVYNRPNANTERD